MNTTDYPKTLAAAKRLEKDQWALGDALLEELGARAQFSKFQTVAVDLRENGIKLSAARLQDLYQASARVAKDTRAAWMTPSLAREAGSVKVLERAHELAQDQGVPTTTRHVVAVRKASHHVAKRAQARSSTPLPRTKSARERELVETPNHVLQDVVDSLELGDLASQATTLGHRFVATLAGKSLSDEDRDYLLEEVDAALETWKAARGAVQNPLAKSVERFLQEQG